MLKYNQILIRCLLKDEYYLPLNVATCISKPLTFSHSPTCFIVHFDISTTKTLKDKNKVIISIYVYRNVVDTDL